MGDTHATHGTQGTSVSEQTEFITFFRDQYSKVVGMITLIGGDRAEAEDATQQAMEAALRRWSTINDPRRWVRQTAKNHFVRTRVRDRRHLEIAIEKGAFTPAVQDPARSSWEDEQWVHTLFRELTPAQRVVFGTILDGLTCSEIAELLGKTRAAVRKNLQLARDRLRGRLDLITLEVAPAPVPTVSRREAGPT
ncbi:RNA polymerase sigma factor [Actinomadura chibensis]|uniref:Sigma-70 family RNA polymerase sigma factor n=1 Tax=Actinomadura chibensis TaxID=392828 RepID=A0A5D0NQ32_9ACTN|nr:sigma-70 family RNA polymerase sigma factor [Actinomadura chibensis]TYB46365.1 sigma-70 family RNA polymerase sigma factor [Actinomadura chibensis]